jgi:formylglycine-generating enzyme required for sulfatase activity
MTTSGAAGAATDPVSKLIKLLAEERKNFTSIEIAETLWLAMQMEPMAKSGSDESQSHDGETSESTVISTVVDPDIEPPPLLPTPTPRANIAAPTPQIGVLPPQTLPVWLADPAMLTDSLAIIRALKPLLQKVDAGTGKRLDEPATVDNIARTRLCLPILAPEKEPWFDIILVVDRGSSMHIWQRLVKDVVRILRHYGAFRDVQVFDLVVNQAEQSPDDAVQLISKPQRPAHRPSELIDQRGRRIVMVLSDCAGAYWWNGTLLPMLQTWGKIMPTVVWQMLPAWMWKRTALGRGTAVAISNDIPGVANQRLKTRVQERDEPEDADQRISVPVVTSEVRDLARWSLMLAGDRREVIPGFLLPQKGGPVPRSKGIEEIARARVQQQILGEGSDTDFDAAFNQELEAIARDRVQRFRELASPQAQRLIMLLAAAPVITLPVVRLIRDAMLYDAQSPLPVAEVFLSGLLQRLPGQEDRELKRMLQEESERAQAKLDRQDRVQLEVNESEPVQLDTQELVQYDFVLKVREVLLEFLPGVDTIEVINSVSAEVERRWNQFSNEDFRAFLTNPNVAVPEALAGLRSFASVTADILEQLGGEYAGFARQLRYGSSVEPPHGDSEIDADDFPLEDLEYEVATITAILDGFDFETACFATFPRSLGGSKAYQKLLENYLLAVFPNESELEQFIEENFSYYRASSETFPSKTPELREKVAALVDDICLREQINILTDRLCERDAQAKAVLLAGEIFRRRAVTWGYTETLSNETGEDIGLDLIAIPGSSFSMGAPESEPESQDDERPQHEVTIGSFYLSRYPITQAQWRVVAGYDPIGKELNPDPSIFKGNNRPVENVSWLDAQEFCQRLSAKTGKDYRLPSEAQWEYACRAGTETPFHFGETITTALANYDGNYTYNDGRKGEYRGETSDVGSFPGNDWGLHDMHGNVWEWCEDDYNDNYQDAPRDGSVWISNDRNTSKILRGGSWLTAPRSCRSASRGYGAPHGYFSDIGFRVVRAVPRTP